MLDDGDSEARIVKRARTDRPPVSTNVSRWTELARLLSVLYHHFCRSAERSRLVEWEYPGDRTLRKSDTRHCVNFTENFLHNTICFTTPWDIIRLE